MMATSPSSTSAFRLNIDTFPRRRRRNNLRGNEAWRWMGTLLNVIGGVRVSRVSREPCTAIRHPSEVRVDSHPNTRHVEENCWSGAPPGPVARRTRAYETAQSYRYPIGIGRDDQRGCFFTVREFSRTQGRTVSKRSWP